MTIILCFLKVVSNLQDFGLNNNNLQIARPQKQLS